MEDKILRKLTKSFSFIILFELMRPLPRVWIKDSSETSAPFTAKFDAAGSWENMGVLVTHS